MAYTIRELAQLELARRASGAKALSEGPKCIQCGVELHGNTTGKRHCSDGLRCDDCYFNELGDLVEKCPIGHPGIRR